MWSEVILAVVLLLAAVLVSVGVWLIYPPAALVVGGVLLGGWAFLTLREAGGG